jgi:hypothetical protein
VPLRDLTALRDWAQTGPPDEVWNFVAAWVSRLTFISYQTPSVPIEELSDRPNYETREAVLAFPASYSEVTVLYRVIYNGSLVDLLLLG